MGARSGRQRVLGGGLLLVLLVGLLAPTPRARAAAGASSSHPSAAASRRVLVAPTHVTVSADQDWQATGIVVEAGERFRLDYVSGQWTYWLGQVPLHGPAGPSGPERYVCTEYLPAEQCSEVVPDYVKGGLVGRIGTQVLRVGEELQVTAQQSGMLWLRINDSADLADLADNAGAIMLRIKVQHPQ